MAAWIKMDRFCVVTNAEKDKNYDTARYLKGFLETKGKRCVLVKDRFIEEEQPEYIDYREIPEDLDCIIILGGDGTFIQAAIDLHWRRVPFLGVNMGTLGFLTEIERESLEADLEKLLTEEYHIEHRMLLEGSIFQDNKEEKRLALNDFVISKAGICRLITLEVYVNEEWIDTYVADGIIVSTPTGSTGYNLSAGGPVLAPEVPAMIITPICPHSLNNRSLVVSGKDKITVIIGKSKAALGDEALVITDGNCTHRLVTGDRIEISPYREDVQLVRLKEMSIFGRLKQKLGRDL